MSRTLRADDPLVISAFHSTLLHQLLLVALVAVVLAVGWQLVRARQLRAAAAGTTGTAVVTTGADGLPAEPDGRRVLRVGFGLLWVLDGLLQLQAGMVLGMPGQVLRPAAAGSPGWLRSLVGVGATIWSNHPVEAAAATVWIQLGIGVALLVAPRGRWSQAAGVVSIGWALVVWVFGEALGGILAHGSSWAFGTPGGVLLYAVAGVLVTVPDKWWRGRQLGRYVTAGLGLFFVGMAVLQAWPGRGFWRGRVGRSPGDLAGMVLAMARSPQPHLLSSWLSSFAGFDMAHGWGVNLFLVVALAAVGAALLSGRARLVVVGAVAAAVLGLATWVLVQDLGFLGGVGTDPNSMVPLLVLVAGGTVALLRPGVPVTEVLGRATERAVRRSEGLAPAYVGRVLAAAVAFGAVLLGSAPMAAAATNPRANPIIAEAIDGQPTVVNAPAYGFTLTDQYGHPVSLASLKGRAVALTFLDPVCTVDCPIIAQEFRQADALLGSSSRHAVFVAVVANPTYHSVAATEAFDEQEGLAHVGNWLFLTGSVRQLERVWNTYGVTVETTPAGSMVAHTNIAYVIDTTGNIREVLDATPGTSDASSRSFASLLAGEMQSALHQ